MSKAKFPATIYVYEVDDKDCSYYSIANGLEEIPEEQDGKAVATYKLTRASNFKIRRDLE